MKLTGLTGTDGLRGQQADPGHFGEQGTPGHEGQTQSEELQGTMVF